MRALAVRAPGLDRETRRAFARAGMEVEIAHPVRLVPLPRPRLTVGFLRRYDVVAFTSPRTVEFLEGGELRALRESGVDVAAVGPRTGRALERCGLDVDVMPERFTTGALADALRGYSRVLALRSRRRTGELRERLERFGVRVRELEVYDLEPRWVRVDPWDFDVVCFFSAMTARCFLRSVGTDLPEPVVSIGPVTSRELERAGLEVVTARESSLRGVVRAAVRVARSRSRRPP